MRVAFLASTLVRGGAETMAVALSQGLARRGHDAAWTLLRAPGDLGERVSAELPLCAGFAPARFPVHRVPALAARLRGSDALYVLDHQNAVVLGAAAGLLAGIPRRVVAVHTTGLAGGRASLGRPFRAALPAYHHVLALSAEHAAYLNAREGVPQDKLRIVPNGIDLERFVGLPSRDAARAALGLRSDAFLVGSVAMLRPEKHHSLLLEAAATLRVQHPELQVVLVGEGPERPSLEARAAQTDLAGAVTFLGRRADVPQVLPALDCFALPSRPEVETQPVAVLEAMAAGIPVIASRVGDLATMLQEGACGRLVPSGDLAAWCAALADAVNNRARTAEHAERGRARVHAYALDRALDALEQALGVCAA